MSWNDIILICLCELILCRGVKNFLSRASCNNWILTFAFQLIEKVNDTWFFRISIAKLESGILASRHYKIIGLIAFYKVHFSAVFYCHFPSIFVSLYTVYPWIFLPFFFKFDKDFRQFSVIFRPFLFVKHGKMSKKCLFFLRGKVGQQFWAGAEGRKSVLGRLRAAAVGSFLKKNCPLRPFLNFSSYFDTLSISNL